MTAMIVMSDAEHRFILHWGEMGARWGINRTVAQIHALLFLSDRPRNADEIVASLGVARSNVSGALRELQAWGIVRAVHQMGDRRTHYEAIHDPWQMARTIADHRKRREIDPTVQALRECLAEAANDGSSAVTKRRLADLVAFFDAIDATYQEVAAVPLIAVRGAMTVRPRLRRLITFLRGQ